MEGYYLRATIYFAAASQINWSFSGSMARSDALLVKTVCRRRCALRCLRKMHVALFETGDYAQTMRCVCEQEVVARPVQPQRRRPRLPCICPVLKSTDSFWFDFRWSWPPWRMKRRTWRFERRIRSRGCKECEYSDGVRVLHSQRTCSMTARSAAPSTNVICTRRCS